MNTKLFLIAMSIYFATNSNSQPNVSYDSDTIDSVVTSLNIDTTAGNPGSSTVYSGSIEIDITDTVVFGRVFITLDAFTSIGHLEIITAGNANNFTVVSISGPTAPGATRAPLVGEVVRGTGSQGVQLDIRAVQQVGLVSAGWDRVESELIALIDTDPGSFSDGHVYADIVALGGGNLAANSEDGYIDRLFINGNLYGDVTTPLPGISGVAVSEFNVGGFDNSNPTPQPVGGQIGTLSSPVTLDLPGDLRQLFAADIYADIDLTHASGTGDISFVADGGSGVGFGDFTGTMKVGSVVTPLAGNSQFVMLGELTGEIEFTGSLRDLPPASSPHWIGDIPAGSLVKVGNIPTDADLTVLGSSSLAGQIIVNQDLNGSFGWDGDVKISGVPKIGPNQSQPYQSPYYEALPSELGGGAIGLVPFNFHNKGSLLVGPGVSPVQFDVNSTVTVANPNGKEIVIEHYGPVFASGTPLEIHKLVSGPIGTETSWEIAGVDNDVTSSWDQAVSSTQDLSARTVTISPVNDTWVTGWYRAKPDALKCAFVSTTPSAAYDSGHSSEALKDYFYFRVKVLSFDLNMNTVVDAPDAMLWITAPVDFNDDNTADAVDFQMLINNMD